MTFGIGDSSPEVAWPGLCFYDSLHIGDPPLLLLLILGGRVSLRPEPEVLEVLVVSDLFIAVIIVG